MTPIGKDDRDSASPPMHTFPPTMLQNGGRERADSTFGTHSTPVLAPPPTGPLDDADYAAALATQELKYTNPNTGLVYSNGAPQLYGNGVNSLDTFGQQRIDRMPAMDGRMGSSVNLHENERTMAFVS